MRLLYDCGTAVLCDFLQQSKKSVIFASFSGLQHSYSTAQHEKSYRLWSVQLSYSTAQHKKRTDLRMVAVSLCLIFWNAVLLCTASIQHMLYMYCCCVTCLLISAVLCYCCSVSYLYLGPVWYIAFFFASQVLSKITVELTLDF